MGNEYTARYLPTPFSVVVSGVESTQTVFISDPNFEAIVQSAHDEIITPEEISVKEVIVTG